MKNERGNILFLILLAVVLFAALSYAVMGSQKGQTKDASAESLQTAASQIIQYTTLMENTVTRLKLSNGCSDTDISFSVSADPDPTGKKCWVYHPAGGSLSQWATLEDKFLAKDTFGANPTVSAWYAAYRGTMQVTASTNAYAPGDYDLVAYVPFISKALCEELQTKLVGTKTPPNNRDIAYLNNRGFTGTYGANGMTRDGTVPTMSGCAYKNDDVFYTYYHVLIAR